MAADEMGTALQRSLAEEIVLLRRVVKSQAETIETQGAIIDALRGRDDQRRETTPPLPLTRGR